MEKTQIVQYIIELFSSLLVKLCWVVFFFLMHFLKLSTSAETTQHRERPLSHTPHEGKRGRAALLDAVTFLKTGSIHWVIKAREYILISPGIKQAHLETPYLH